MCALSFSRFFSFRQRKIIVLNIQIPSNYQPIQFSIKKQNVFIDGFFIWFLFLKILQNLPSSSSLLHASAQSPESVEANHILDRFHSRRRNCSVPSNGSPRHPSHSTLGTFQKSERGESGLDFWRCEDRAAGAC